MNSVRQICMGVEGGLSHGTTATGPGVMIGISGEPKVNGCSMKVGGKGIVSRTVALQYEVIFLKSFLNDLERLEGMLHQIHAQGKKSVIAMASGEDLEGADLKALINCIIRNHEKIEKIHGKLSLLTSSTVRVESEDWSLATQKKSSHRMYQLFSWQLRLAEYGKSSNIPFEIHWEALSFDGEYFASPLIHGVCIKPRADLSPLLLESPAVTQFSIKGERNWVINSEKAKTFSDRLRVCKQMTDIDLKNTTVEKGATLKLPLHVKRVSLGEVLGKIEIHTPELWEREHGVQLCELEIGHLYKGASVTFPKGAKDLKSVFVAGKSLTPDQLKQISLKGGVLRGTTPLPENCVGF